MVCGSKMNPVKQFFYVFDIKNGILFMNGINLRGILYNTTYHGWSVERKADDDEIKEFYELLERFVRGDGSRHTEGTGLGLNIAQSLTKLQNGSFVLTVDGDFFKAEVSLPEAT